MFRGYLNEEERYRKCFAGGWYLTGDLARRDADGYFWFVGRADDVIKSSGHLIGPFEVESALMEHPAVAEAGVIGKPDPVAGEIVKAFVSLKPALRAERRPAARLARVRTQAARSGGRAARRSTSSPACPRPAAARSCAGCSRRASSGCPKATPPRWRAAEPLSRATAESQPNAQSEREHALDAAARDAARSAASKRNAPSFTAPAKIRGFVHLYIGEEAVAVGAMQALEPDDAIVATYREHGHALVRGVPATPIMAEMYGKREGCSRGRGGSMHLFDAATRFYGGNAIVGGGLPLAVGLALADKMQGRRRVTACFFGEGAVAEGEFHECMNLAALWKLPVLFLLREQPLRDGHRARTLRIRDRSASQSVQLRNARLAGGRHGRGRLRGRGAPRGGGRARRRRSAVP